ncbi:MAG: 30S ribosomal protein S4 [Candidatus Aenigmarchaeota archaeon]|nr:30S ribosomal protein S4 [Candidatus Aenigmarchaeota archaeon]
MGHPKKFRRKWNRPKKLFDKVRIEFELDLKREYGFRRKREIWKLENDFKNIKRRARKISAEKDKEGEKMLINKLVKLNLMEKSNTGLEGVLNLKLEDFCERRLQTILRKKGIANTVKQARQLIAHKKVLVADRIINQPNYIVSAEEESKILLRKKEKKKEVKEDKKEVVEESKDENKKGEIEKEKPKNDKDEPDGKGKEEVGEKKGRIR